MNCTKKRKRINRVNQAYRMYVATIGSTSSNTVATAVLCRSHQSWRNPKFAHSGNQQLDDESENRSEFSTFPPRNLSVYLLATALTVPVLSSTLTSNIASDGGGKIGMDKERSKKKKKVNLVSFTSKILCRTSTSSIIPHTYCGPVNNLVIFFKPSFARRTAI